MNQELEQYLRCYVNQSQDDWDLWLSMAEYAYNSRIHSATKKVPFELVLGRIPELVYKKGPTEVDEQGWIKRAEQAQEEAKKAMAKSQEQMERYANRHRAGLPKIEVGDKVLLDARNLTLLTPSRKLSARNLGPYTVIAKHGMVNYELDLPKDLRIHPVFHAGLIIPYKKGDNPEGDHRPDPEIIQGEEEYEVEEIEGIEKRQGKWMCRVKWKGYPEDENTWEPLSNME